MQPGIFWDLPFRAKYKIQEIESSNPGPYMNSVNKPVYSGGLL